MRASSRSGSWASSNRSAASRPVHSLEAAQAQLDTFARRLQQEQPEAESRPAPRRQDPERIRERRPQAAAVGPAAVDYGPARGHCLRKRRPVAAGPVRDAPAGDRDSAGTRGEPRQAVRQLLTESALLAAAGAVVALLVAGWLIPLLPALLPPGPSFVRYDTRLDLRVVVATLVTCTLTVLFFGLAPAVRGLARTSTRSSRPAGGTPGGPSADGICSSCRRRCSA